MCAPAGDEALFGLNPISATNSSMTWKVASKTQCPQLFMSNNVTYALDCLTQMRGFISTSGR